MDVPVARRPHAGAARPAAGGRGPPGRSARSRAQAAVALRQHRLAAAVAEAEPLAEVDRIRTALLAAVSHDLRTPLASAKAAVSALRSDGVQWSEPERAELLATADESLDRLSRLVENLLDLSRLQAGALAVFPQPVGLEDVAAGGAARARSRRAVESTLPRRPARGDGRPRPAGAHPGQRRDERRATLAAGPPAADHGQRARGTGWRYG